MAVRPTERPATASCRKKDFSYFGSHSRIGSLLFIVLTLQQFPSPCDKALKTLGKSSLYDASFSSLIPVFCVSVKLIKNYQSLASSKAKEHIDKVAVIKLSHFSVKDNFCI